MFTAPTPPPMVSVSSLHGPLESSPQGLKVQCCIQPWQRVQLCNLLYDVLRVLGLYSIPIVVSQCSPRITRRRVRERETFLQYLAQLEFVALGIRSSSSEGLGTRPRLVCSHSPVRSPARLILQQRTNPSQDRIPHTAYALQVRSTRRAPFSAIAATRVL
ncbi:hypothetical protein GY45DRAFT_607946 [Cubamyces sp. BRFM 1775]|nr:hypothetical protein GY45DRAFT_607946 [Cubamyces sp. BRFM 1775]